MPRSSPTQTGGLAPSKSGIHAPDAPPPGGPAPGVTSPDGPAPGVPSPALQNVSAPDNLARKPTLRTSAMAVGLIVVQSTLYGLGDPISKVAYESVSVFSLLAVRYFIAFVLIMAVAGRRVVAGLRAEHVRIWLPSSICLAGCYVVSNVALGLSAATSMAFLRSLSVVMTPLVALAIYGTPYNLRRLPVLLLMVAGLYLICAHGGVTTFGLAEVLVLVSDMLTAMALVLGARAMERMDPVALTAAQTGVSLVMAAGCALVFEGGLELSGATPQVWAIICYLAVLCTLAGFLLQNMALRHISATAVAMAQCLYPVMTAAFSHVLLGEALTVAGLVGAAIVVVCVVADTLAEHGAPK